MKKFCKIILFLWSFSANGNGIVVVTWNSSDLTLLTQSQVTNLFLGRSGGSHLIPFDQDDVQLRERFYREVVGMSLTSIRAYWAKRVFTGRGRPPVVLGQDEAEQTLHDRPGSVIYFTSERQPAETKVLFSTESGELP